MVAVVDAGGSHAEIAAPGGPESPPGAALDLHEGIPAAEVARGCPRWPDHLRLQSTLGALVPGRCRAVNLCDYCARLAAVETAEVLALDALNNSAPGLWSVLTTATATLDVAAFQRAREGTARAVRRHWPEAQSATLVEFTTGYGLRSGGDRRPHWNDLWKGVPIEDAQELHAVLADAWCSRVAAEPQAQYVGEVSMVGGLMRYLALHFQKSDQAPPTGWRGHRFRTTRGYLDRPMAQAREEARASLRYRRELWRARQEGIEGEGAELLARMRLHEAGELAWELVRMVKLPLEFGDDGLPSAWSCEPVPVRG